MQQAFKRNGCPDLIQLLWRMGSRKRRRSRSISGPKHQTRKAPWDCNRKGGAKTIAWRSQRESQ
jgi:hypothetical protein